MTIGIGDRLPDAGLFTLSESGPRRMTTDEVFGGRKVLLFGVPGPFTPTCHRNHLPGYIEHNAAIRGKGVDEIAVVAVADPFVMDAWAKETGAKGKILFLADGNGEFAQATGLSFDGSARGMGVHRLQRFAMIVEDRVVKTLSVEESPGQVGVSGAGAMLAVL